MSFNPTKCVVLRITRKRNPINATYKILNHDLELVKQRKYLGVTLTDNLSWNEHVDETTKKGKQHIGFLAEEYLKMHNRDQGLVLRFSRLTCD